MEYLSVIICIVFCFCSFWFRVHRLSILGLASVLQAAQFFAIGPVRIWFYHPVAICCCFIGFSRLLSGDKNLAAILRKHMLLIYSFCFLVVIGSFLFPRLFGGLPVFESRGGMDINDVRSLYPLVPTISNIAQAFYLILNCSLIIFFCGELQSGDPWGKLRRCLDSLFLFGIGLFFWQLVSIKVDIYFPENFIRAGDLVVYTTEALVGAERMNGSFFEPADLGLFSGALFGYACASILIESRYLFGIFSLLSASLMIFLSGSTTAYVSTFGALLGVLLTSRAIKFNFVKLSCVLGALCIASCVLIQNDYVWQVFESTVLQKGETSSFENRFFSSVYSFELFNETFGLGVGLGSNRPSSMIALLFSCIGILAIPFLWFLFIRSFKLAKSNVSFSKVIYCAYFAVLAAISVSIPDLSHVNFTFFTVLALSTVIYQENAACCSVGVKPKS